MDFNDDDIPVDEETQALVREFEERTAREQAERARKAEEEARERTRIKEESEQRWQQECLDFAIKEKRRHILREQKEAEEMEIERARYDDWQRKAAWEKMEAEEDHRKVIERRQRQRHINKEKKEMEELRWEEKKRTRRRNAREAKLVWEKMDVTGRRKAKETDARPFCVFCGSRTSYNRCAVCLRKQPTAGRGSGSSRASGSRAGSVRSNSIASSSVSGRRPGSRATQPGRPRPHRSASQHSYSPRSTRSKSSRSSRADDVRAKLEEQESTIEELKANIKNLQNLVLAQQRS